MASPFTFFRRHAAIMMVVLIGLSMAAFIILDPLIQLAQNPGQLSRVAIFLLPLLGGALAWTIKAASGRAIVGTPDEVALETRRQCAASDINYFLCRFAFGDITLAEAIRSVDYFRDQLMNGAGWTIRTNVRRMA